LIRNDWPLAVSPHVPLSLNNSPISAFVAVSTTVPSSLNVAVLVEGTSLPASVKVVVVTHVPSTLVVAVGCTGSVVALEP
jgi:hypothetical protein